MLWCKILSNRFEFLLVIQELTPCTCWLKVGTPAIHDMSQKNNRGPELWMARWNSRWITRMLYVWCGRHRKSQGSLTVKPLIWGTPNYIKCYNEMFVVSSCSCLCPIDWNQVLSREWRCSWSSADRRCSNYIWVINNVIAFKGTTYIRSLTVNDNGSCRANVSQQLGLL